MRNGLARFTDPTSPVFGVASTVAFGALSLVDPARLSPARRRAYRTGLATTTAWWTAVTTDRNRTVYVPGNVVAGLLAGGTVWALAEASETLDARIMTRLEAAGVRHPRPWVAALSAASVLVSFAVDRASTGAEPEVRPEDLMRTRPVTRQVREVVRGILQASDTPDAHVLLTQLAVAQESYFDDGDDGFSTMVGFEVPDEIVRVVPHNQVYPVQARFRASNGTELQVSLQLDQGKLAHLAVDIADDVVDEGANDIAEELLNRWPDPADLRYVLEGTDGGSLPAT
ncbi:hypothetical protein [Kocuria sp. CH-021]|uniref:hypothetical protein n=1 Tax=Kocuria sp. CH-021 TaxID=3406735 RepID=UPI003C716B1E